VPGGDLGDARPDAFGDVVALRAAFVPGENSPKWNFAL